MKPKSKGWLLLRGNIWHIGYTPPGGTEQRQSGSMVKEEAQRQLEEIIGKLAAGTLRPAPSTTTWTWMFSRRWSSCTSADGARARPSVFSGPTWTWRPVWFASRIRRTKNPGRCPTPRSRDWSRCSKTSGSGRTRSSGPPARLFRACGTRRQADRVVPQELGEGV